VGSATWINGLVSAVLLVLATTLVVYAMRAWPAELSHERATSASLRLR
jgi:succinate dehydrogenase hydrophobic anchor subunit